MEKSGEDVCLKGTFNQKLKVLSYLYVKWYIESPKVHQMYVDEPYNLKQTYRFDRWTGKH